MSRKTSASRKFFVVINTIFLISLGVICLLPMIHELAVSFSDKVSATTNQVGLIPKNFNLDSYEYIMKRTEFWTAFGISIMRCVVGLVINIVLMCITAYPLSKTKNELRCRTPMVWFFVITILFSGGMIPTYLVVYNVNLIDSLWSMILPGALNVYNMILMINFMRTIPKSMEESARLDGAGELTVLFRIVLPNMLPALATMCVFTIVGHWNSWFDGMLYLNNAKDYPLQTYLQAILIQQKTPILSKAAAMAYQNISDQTVKSAQIFVGALPVLLVYPFLQRYFMTGLVMGSVKE